MKKGTFLLGILFLFLFLNSCRKDEVDIVLLPDAGNSFTDIENDGYVVTLGAKPAKAGETGIWRIYMGNNGKFDDVHDPHTKFYGEPGESYLLGWELSKGDVYKADEIYVSFKPLNPVVLLNIEDTIYNNVSLKLRAEEAKYGAQGKWEIIEGTNGRIENSDKATADFIGVEKSKYTVRWTLTYGSKEEYIDISFYTDVLRADAGEDNLDIVTFTDIREPKYYNMNAFLPAGASASWEIISGGNGNVISLNDPHSIFQGMADTIYKILWNVKVDNYVSTDTLKLRFRGKWGVWVDERDNQEYRYVRIGKLEWMAENFNYAAPWSEYGRNFYYGQTARAEIADGHPVDTEEDRKFYGRLYNYYGALDAKPEGWRIPTREDFDNLYTILGGDLVYFDKIIIGGETGLDINFGGVGSYTSYADISYKDYFGLQDKEGYYITDNYNPVSYKVSFKIYTQDGISANASLSAFYSLGSVRYVRDVQ